MRDVLHSEDAEKIKSVTQSLEQIIQKVGTKLYQSAQSQTPPQQNQTEEKKESVNEQPDKKDENVVEGEYEDVKDDTGKK